MALSRCGHCEGSLFELRETNVMNANYRFHFVQCSSCGAPIAAVEHYHIGTILDGIENRIKKIEQHLNIYDP